MVAPVRREDRLDDRLAASVVLTTLLRAHPPGHFLPPRGVLWDRFTWSGDEALAVTLSSGRAEHVGVEVLDGREVVLGRLDHRDELVLVTGVRCDLDGEDDLVALVDDGLGVVGVVEAAVGRASGRCPPPRRRGVGGGGTRRAGGRVSRCRARLRRPPCPSSRRARLKECLQDRRSLEASSMAPRAGLRWRRPERFRTPLQLSSCCPENPCPQQAPGGRRGVVRKLFG